MAGTGSPGWTGDASDAAAAGGYRMTSGGAVSGAGGGGGGAGFLVPPGCCCTSGDESRRRPVGAPVGPRPPLPPTWAAPRPPTKAAASTSPLLPPSTGSATCANWARSRRRRSSPLEARQARRACYHVIHMDAGH